MSFINQRVAAFSQMGLMKGSTGTSAAAQQGACHNFALAWCAAIANAPTEAASARMTGLERSAGRASAVLQKAFVDRWTLDGATNADALCLQAMSLEVARNGKLPYGPFNLSRTTGALASDPQSRAVVYSFWFNGSVAGAGGGAHSIAFFQGLAARRGRFAVTGTEIVAFDPNYGEFVIPQAQFATWLSDLFANYGPVTNDEITFVKPLDASF